MMPAVTIAATARTVRLGVRNDAAKRNRQYGITRRSAISPLATFWFATNVGSTLMTRERPPRMANDRATQPAPAIRWRTHW